MKLLKYIAVAFVLAFVQIGAVMAQPIQTCTITTQNLVPAGVATANSACALNTGGMSVVSIQVTGTYTGALSAQVTTDGSTWLTLAGATTFTRDTNSATSATIPSAAQDGFSVVVAGKSNFRITALGAVTGTATITMRPSANGGSTGSSGGGGGGAVTSTDGGLATLGTTTDAKSTATDATSITLMQASKQISASAQLVAAASGAPGDTKCAGSSSSCSLAASLKALQDTSTQIPPTLGPQTPANSLATFNPAATGTQTIVASSASDVTILASNTARKGATVVNDSASASLYLLLSNATSSATVYTVLLSPGGYYEVPFSYSGVLKGIWTAAVGNARVTEFTN